MPYRLFARIVVLVVCFAGIPRTGLAGGLDTPPGVANLPFHVEGAAVMNMTQTGLAIAPGNAAFSPSYALDVLSPASSGGIVAHFASSNAGNTNVIVDNSRVSGGYNAILQLQNSERTWFVDAGGAASGLGSNGAFFIYDANRPGVAFLIDASGNVGLGGTANNGTFGGMTLVVDADGNVGFGTNSPSGRIDSETGTASLWAGMFNYNAGTPTGAYGVWSYGTQYGLYGQTVGGQGVQGNATGSGNGVLGTSTNGWAGNFQGNYGVYGQSSSGGWAGMFNSQDSQNGVYIDNTAHNTQLCLNGNCTTSLPTHAFGGFWAGHCASTNINACVCDMPNPYANGSCSCPSGFSATEYKLNPYMVFIWIGECYQ